MGIGIVSPESYTVPRVNVPLFYRIGNSVAFRADHTNVISGAILSLSMSYKPRKLRANKVLLSKLYDMYLI